MPTRSSKPSSKKASPPSKKASPRAKKTSAGADPLVEQGPGGESHQYALGADDVMTTAQGTPVADAQNSLTVGDRGPTVLDDFVLREKIFHFDHERIPERVVHARGYGAHGYFENYEPLAEFTSAELFQTAGHKTPVFVRFSTVAGNKGSADLARDVRGFAVKFYTQQGNWDLVGNNIPVFFVQDAIKFPDLIHAVKDEPDRGFPQAQSAHDNFWDFASLMPETTHMLLWQMSDRTIPRSFRFMEGFGVHTYRFIDADGVSRFVKFLWKPKLGVQSVLWNEAVKINGADPDFHRRDLWDAITAGEFPEWELSVQVFGDDFADNFGFDVLDATKLIPEEVLAPRPIGRLVLDRMVDNFFAETEQVAFCTNNVVPGIGFTNDPLLQGRNFSYLDTQLKRLGGPNFTQLPINAPKCPVRHFQQDGHMAMVNPVGRVNYEPNSRSGDQRGPREDPSVGYQAAAIHEAGATRRVRSELFADHYSQARQFWVSQTVIEQGHIVDAFVFELSKVETLAIRTRLVANLGNVDGDLATRVANGLGLAEVPVPSPPARPPIHNLPPSPALSILARTPTTRAGRKVGIVVTDDTDAGILDALTAALADEGMHWELIAPHIGGVVTSDGAHRQAQQKIDGGPSVVYDAVAVLASAEGAALLAVHAPAKDFVNDAHAHCKFIGYVAAAAPLFEAVGLVVLDDDGEIAIGGDEGYVGLDGGGTGDDAGGVATFVERLIGGRFWPREAMVKMP